MDDHQYTGLVMDGPMQGQTLSHYSAIFTVDPKHLRDIVYLYYGNTGQWWLNTEGARLWSFLEARKMPKDPPPSNEFPPADRRGGPEML